MEWIWPDGMIVVRAEAECKEEGGECDAVDDLGAERGRLGRPSPWAAGPGLAQNLIVVRDKSQPVHGGYAI